MHLAPLTVLCSLGLALAAGAEDAPVRPAMSDRLAAEVRASLPRYESRVDRPAPAAETPPDPDVVLLPRMEIRERRLPDTDPDDWLTRDALEQKAKVRYLASMNGLTAFLNSWSIPLIGAPVGARALASRRAEQLREEFGRISGIGAAIKEVDPRASAEIRDEIERALTGRPPARR